ncbi:hypothetical protein Peur_044525 [Populus x canadensis]
MLEPPKPDCRLIDGSGSCGPLSKGKQLQVQEDALLKLMDATCRRATAPPAPPDGLYLVDIGYTEFDPQNCLIP